MPFILTFGLQAAAVIGPDNFFRSILHQDVSV